MKIKLAFTVGLLGVISMPNVFADDEALTALLKSQITQGYLDKTELPNSLTLLPPPPKANSTSHAHDLAINKQALALQQSARWKQAAKDSNLLFPKAAEIFSCATDIEINQKNTPTLYKILQKSLVDIGSAPSLAKNNYQRKRPFMENGQDICHLTADEQQQTGFEFMENKKLLAQDGSYPSGHTAAGWGWALIMTQLVPTHQDHILLRGRTYGESRVICNVHW